MFLPNLPTSARAKTLFFLKKMNLFLIIFHYANSLNLIKFLVILMRECCVRNTKNAKNPFSMILGQTAL